MRKIVAIASSSKSMLTRSVETTTRGFAISFGRSSLIFWSFAVPGMLISIASAPDTIGLLGAGLALVMVAIAVVDRRSFVIPDALTAAGLGLAVVHAAAQEPDAMVHAVLLAGVRGAALAVLFLIFRSVYARIRGRQGLGLGDVKLAAVAGAWLDWSLMPIAVELAAVAALCAYVLRQAVLGRPISVTNRVPFGLFFAPAIWACWVLETTWLAPF